MAKLFTISPQIRRLAASGIDTMILELGKDCLLGFDAQKVKCPNCHFNTQLQRSSGIYNGTGVRPFTRPPCPVCRGDGFITYDHTEQARFLIDWQPKPQNFVAPGVTIPQGIVQTKGFVKDLPKVLQAKYIIVDFKHANYQTHKFARWGEPVQQGNIVPNRYFIAFWTRFGE